MSTTTAPVKGSTKPATSLLILSSKAGSMTPEIEAKLRKAFGSSLAVEFDPKMDLEELVAPGGMVVVAGGDGTIGWVVRRLADTKHPVGILSLGTFNNFAKSLHLPGAEWPQVRGSLASTRWCATQRRCTLGGNYPNDRSAIGSRARTGPCFRTDPCARTGPCARSRLRARTDSGSGFRTCTCFDN